MVRSFIVRFGRWWSLTWQVHPDMEPTRTQLFGQWCKRTFNPGNWEDGVFMDDVRQATLRGAHPAANALFFALSAFIIIFIFWAGFAKLDEVTRGVGAVIPSGRVQTVQNLEGGVIEEILVRDGDVVQSGDVLIRIDDTGFASTLGAQQGRYYNLVASQSRLQAELDWLDGAEKPTPKFPKDLREQAPELMQREQNLLASRMQEFEAAKGVFARQVSQRDAELRDARSKQKQSQRSYELANEELQLTRPLFEDGVVSRVELLRLERQVNELAGERDAAKIAISRAQAALSEAQERMQEATSKFRNEVMAEMAKQQEESERLASLLTAEADRVSRTTVRAPVDAVVKQVLVNTVGGVVQPGMNLVELLPLDDSLLVEARIRPNDIAFIRPGQDAMVKITAYDFSIYGGLPGEVEQISADTITNEEEESFYVIRVRTQDNALGTQADPLPIIPGMVAQVDILTGEKSVLDYLLKPLNKARTEALRER